MKNNLETQKRLDIIDIFRIELEELSEGIMVGGSMGYGQNFAIKNTSDIDTVVVCQRENIGDLAKNKLLNKKVDFKVLELFKENKINFFWVVQEINNVEVNFFIYNKQAYEDFCLLKGSLKGYIQFKPFDFQDAYTFEGKLVKFKRFNIKPFGNGFLFEKPALLDGKTYCGMVPRQDFYYSSRIVCEKNNFFRNLERKVWRSSIIQLIKEHGKNLNINGVNILNTHYIYQKERKRIPNEIIKKIQERTKLELEQIIS